MKFDPIGVHPVEDRPLNLVEQTWTYAAAVAAARQLLLLHPEAGEFRRILAKSLIRSMLASSSTCGLVRHARAFQPDARVRSTKRSAFTPASARPEEFAAYQKLREHYVAIRRCH